LIQTGGLPEIRGITKKPDPLVSPGKILENFHASVGRTVVDDNKFKIPKRLRQNTSDGFDEKAPGIVNGHHDRDSWSRIHFEKPAPKPQKLTTPP
jgi:hypothetical protein